MAKKTSKKGAFTPLSFKMDNFSAGGFFPEGVHKVIKAVTVSNYDADGKFDTPATGLMLTCRAFDLKKKALSTSDTEERELFYSMGDSEHFIAVDADGEQADEGGIGVAVAEGGTRKSLSKKCKFFMLLQRLADAGFDTDSFDNDVSIFDKQVFTFENVVTKKAEDMEDTEDGEKKYDKTFPFPAEWHEKLSGGEDADEDEKPKRGSKKPSKKDEDEEEEADEADAAGDEDEADGEDDADEAETEDASEVFAKALRTVMGKNKKGASVAKVRTLIFKEVKDLDNADEITDLAKDAKELTSALKGSGFKLSADKKEIVPAK